MLHFRFSAYDPNIVLHQFLQISLNLIRILAPAAAGFKQRQRFPRDDVDLVIVDLAVGFDDENSFLRTADGLPLFTMSKEPKLIRAAITKNGEKSVDVWQDDGAVVEQFRVSNVDRMMAFDCGDFELR